MIYEDTPINKAILTLAGINFHSSYRELSGEEKKKKQDIFDFLKGEGVIVDFPDKPEMKGKFDFAGENRDFNRSLYSYYADIT